VYLPSGKFFIQQVGTGKIIEKYIDQRPRGALLPLGRQAPTHGKKNFYRLSLLMFAALGWYFRFSIAKKFLPA